MRPTLGRKYASAGLNNDSSWNSPEGEKLLHWSLLVPQRVKQQQAGAGDDRRVGYIEVWKVVSEDVDLDEVYHRAVGDAVVNVAQRAGKDQRQSDGGQRDAIRQANHDDENHQRQI